MHVRRNQGAGHDSSHGIDLAPMLDFVINLLIFFIITAVFLKESVISVNRPTSITSTSAEDAKAVEIRADGEIRIDDKPVDVRAVRANVEKIRALKPESGLLIVANEDAPTGTLVEVVDQIHLGGIYDITFSTAKR